MHKTPSEYRLQVEAPVDIGRGRVGKTGKYFDVAFTPQSMPVRNPYPVFALLRATSVKA
jgi:hypothetical protein